MKARLIPILCLLLALLLGGCSGKETAAEESRTAQTTQMHEHEDEDLLPYDEQSLLVGVWRNEGRYSEGRDFVETMTLDEGGICTVTLDYQGTENYQTLTGVYTVAGGRLLTSFQSGDSSFERNYLYSLDGDTLTLDNGQKTITYQKISEP